MSNNAAITKAIEDMMVLFNKIVKEDLDEDSYGFSEMIPLLVQGSLDGEIDSQKLDEYLSIFDNEAVKNKIKEKIGSLKVKHLLTQQNYEESLKMVAEEENKRKESAKIKETVQQQEKSKHEEKSQPASKSSDNSKRKGKHTEDKEKPKKERGASEEIVNEGGDGDIVLEKKDNLKKELESQGKQKCRFFPYCKNEETCEFFHPKEKVINLETIEEQKKYT